MIICWHKSKGFFWMRVFGYGFKVKSLKLDGLLFTERYGGRGHIALFGWSFGVLRRSTWNITLPWRKI